MARKVKGSKAYTIRLQEKQKDSVEELVERTGYSSNKIIDSLVTVAVLALSGNTVGVQAIQASFDAQANLHAVERKRFTEIREARRKADAARIAAFRREQPREAMPRPLARAKARQAVKPEAKKPDSK